ncbi:MAG TPA: hypothetical protein GXZ48_02765 [Acholeplasmataceae bacterium]|nr:hypothetical protein [Acholeplasmataceae bacterium]
MSKSLIYKLLDKNSLIDDRKIFAAGTVKRSNIKDDLGYGRCLSIKNNELIISRLGGWQKIAPLFILLKENINCISKKLILFGLEVDIYLKTDNFEEIYNITVNKKMTKEIIKFFDS